MFQSPATVRRLVVGAGWDADQTVWLRDVFTGTRRLTSWRGTPGSEALP